MRVVTQRALMVTVMGMVGVAGDAAAAPCDAVAAQVRLPHTMITAATLVDAGAFTLPAAATPVPGAGPAAGRGGGGGRGPRFDTLPAFCRVSAVSRPTSESNIGIEIWMPATGWNGKFQVTGWAFWGGAINYGPLVPVLQAGYATATTDGGHQDGNVPRFALAHGEKLTDWSERAWHETTVAAKAAIAAFYERPPTASSFNACGGGTRQAMMEIQQYPADYDIVAAGGPSYDTTRFTFTQSWMFDATHRDAASQLPASKLPVVHAAAMAACDSGDGATDGVISNPRACRFDPAVLACKAGDAADCLTPAQVSSVQAVYDGPRNPRTGEQISGGMMPGSELSWSAVTTATRPTGGFNNDFFRYFVFGDPSWNPVTRPLNYDSDVALATVPALRRLGATEPDISAFLDRGGKLLIYGGWNDTAIPTQVATGYYESVVRAVGEAKARNSVRLFMIPGMGHCPAAPTAMDGYFFDPLPVIEAWQQGGAAPNEIAVRRRSGGRDERTIMVRPYGMAR
jgi:feruloyl esterase